jgi:hypothetical protein
MEKTIHHEQGTYRLQFLEDEKVAQLWIISNEAVDWSSVVWMSPAESIEQAEKLARQSLDQGVR